MDEQGVEVGGAMMLPSKTIVENAVMADNVKTLVAAVTAAGLVDTLSGDGPFTVFAPTDDAFAALPAGTVDDLVKPENKEQLTAILTYHVLAGAFKSTDLAMGEQKVATVNGKEVTIVRSESGVTVNGANVIIADVISSNGVTHVIDTVLMP